MILAIDPGPEQSAFVLYDEQSQRISTHHWEGMRFGKVPNALMLEMVHGMSRGGRPDRWLVVEMISSYGMPVGREVFETCVVIGQLLQAWESNRMPSERVTRGAVKLHVCNSAKAKDGNVRQALIDRFGGKEKAIGNKKQPGPLYGVKADVWAALAVAVTYADKRARAV